MLLTRIPSIAIAAAVLWSGSASVSAAADNINQDDFVFEHVSCKGGDNEIRIVVTGVKKAVGLITADLYLNDQEHFLHGGEGRVKKVKFAAKEPRTQFCMTVPEAGEYALAIYQDKNANGKFDKNALGLPAEPWGVSQNPKILFGPPSVEEALFSVDETGAKLEIDLN